VASPDGAVWPSADCGITWHWQSLALDLGRNWFQLVVS
jgi:hypothetical protein